MKNLTKYIWLMPILFFFSCKKENPKANDLLNQARSQYIAGQYVVAKKTIDSIAKVDPKGFVQINAGYALLDSVRYAENIQTITNSENSLKDIESKLVKQKALFNYEINAKYQNKGNYIPKNAPLSSSTGLYSGVDADGKLFLESVSNQPIKHNAAAVSVAGGNRAETFVVTDDGANYRSQVGGKTVETVHYSEKRENGVASFVAANQDKNISVTLKGKSSLSFNLSSNAKKGISESYLFSKLFKERDSLHFQMEKSRRLIQYLDKKRAKEITSRIQKQLNK